MLQTILILNNLGLMSNFGDEIPEYLSTGISELVAWESILYRRLLIWDTELDCPIPILSYKRRGRASQSILRI